MFGKEFVNSIKNIYEIKDRKLTCYMKEEKTKIILLPILLKSNVVYFIFRKGTKCQLDLDYLAIKKNSKKK